MATESRPNVLIADDEQTLLKSYVTILETRYDVTAATTGTEALEQLDDEIDVAVLDRRLPDATGAEILTEIRDRNLDCQVVFCSAVVPGLELVDLEPDDYLHKPVGSDRLFDAIETQLQQPEYSTEKQAHLRLERLQSTLESACRPSQLHGDPRYQELLDSIEEQDVPAESSHDSRTSTV